MKRIFATMFVVALSLFSSLILCAEVKIVTVRAQGKCELSRHITLDQAEAKALQEAKKDALQKAGISEEVWSVFGMITENDGQHFSEAYSEMSAMAIGGLVHLLENPSYSREYSKTEKREYVVCKINAEVKKGETVDKSFQIKVDGLSQVYNHRDLIHINITPSQDAHIKVFWFDPADGALLFPNSHQNNSFVIKGEQLNIPNEKYKFRANKKNLEEKTEIANVMVIATKKDYPYFGDKVTFETLLNWVYNIPASDRCAYYETIYIK